MTRSGLIDHVRRGHYALRQLGMLGTPATAEDIAMSVSAAFKGLAHRMAYRSALYEHNLLVHPPARHPGRDPAPGADPGTFRAAASGRDRIARKA